MTVATFESLSRQFDSTREEIVAHFRERINQGKRSKLTKQELEELIEIFITRLQSTDDSESIARLCQAEIALLEEGYPSASVAKNYLPKYRQAIALAIDEGRIVLNEHNSHAYTYVKDGGEQTTTEHWALTYLKYSQADYEQFARSTIANNNLKQDSLQPVNLQLYLEAVCSLLNSSQPLELALAIAAVTGRRYSEVMARGHFEPTNHPYQIRFRGQLKKRDSDVDSYIIYTLVPASQVLDAGERFRTHPDIAALKSASIAEINQLNTPLNRLVERYFQAPNLVPVLSEEAGVTVQNLRGIYGEIAVHFFCPPTMGTHRFIQQKLGHLISDSQLAQRKNSGSCEHYFHYYLVDRQGKQLAEKGVLLPQLSLNHKVTNGISSSATESEQLELTARNLEGSSEEDTIPASSGAEVEAANLTSSNVKSETGNRDRALSDRRSDLPKGGSQTNPPSQLKEFSTPEAIKPSENQFQKSNSVSHQSSTGKEVWQLPPDFDVSEFVTPIGALIKSNDYRDLLVGLMAVTGLDAASLLKLLVFKQAAAPHLILYCQQLHSPDCPLQQLLTLIDAYEVIEAIFKLRRHPEAIDFAHRLTGSEINSQVNEFIPDVLLSIGLIENLDLALVYQVLIRRLLTENLGNRSSQLSLSPNTKSNFEQWQQHFHTDAERTLEELMRLSAIALASQDSQPNSLPNQSLDAPLPSDEPSPWLAISRLSDTVARLSDRITAQNDRLFDLVLGGSSLPETTTSNRLSKPQPVTSPPKPFHQPEPQSNSFSSDESDKSSASARGNRPNPNLAPKSTTSSSVASSVDSDSAALPTDDSLAQLSSNELRHNRSPGAPAEKLSRALDAVIEYNQNQERPDDRWRINTSVLQQLTGCFNASVKDFVALHQETIDQHNHTFGLTSVRHNSAHKGQDPNSFITW